jgi:hypothetical protein
MADAYSLTMSGYSQRLQHLAAAQTASASLSAVASSPAQKVTRVRGSFFFGGFCEWSAVPDHCHEGVGAPSGSRPSGQIAWKILARKNVISEPVAAISR